MKAIRAALAALAALSLVVLIVALISPAGAASPSPSGAASSGTASASPSAASSPSPTRMPPVLAYYYIWFDPSSWDRAKTDYPILGRYSSDDPKVMRQHIVWAKAAGITGFIVSWKGTEKLNRRLEELIKIAQDENFKLAIIYQGLDFARKPLPLSQVSADLELFANQYAKSPVFHIFEKPMVIWSGTWEFSASDVASVTKQLRSRILVLGSEKNVKGLDRLGGAVDGDAYYWSSVNPDTFPNYQAKLIGMGDAVHARHGLWIAPAAVGFDARGIGGSSVVDRNSGGNLRRQFSAAIASSPDAVGIISWNEFSENSHLEPSTDRGDQALRVLADILHTTPPVIPNLDSSNDGPISAASGSLAEIGRGAALVGVIVLSLLALIVTARRRRR